MNKLRLGTRTSTLARWQAHWVAAQLSAAGHEVELIPLTTRGDLERDAIHGLGGQGLFTKEIQRALLDGQIDLAVHSAKDLPTDRVEGLVLAAIPPREDTADALISRHGEPLDALPPAAVIGTGSLRRRAQLLHVRPDLQMRDIRGNVDTRLEKLAAGQYDAIVLAQAGLNRLGLTERISQVFGTDLMLPAVGQGALAIEVRVDDPRTLAALNGLDDLASHRAVSAERTLLAALGGGCLAPIGALARGQLDGLLRLDAVVLSANGQRRIAAGASSETDDAIGLAGRVADELLARGARELVQASRGGSA